MPLALTPALLDWLRQDPGWPQQAVGWRLAQRWRALWGGVNLRLSESLAEGRPQPHMPDPVLIVGPWRSGTTVLHELLVAATGAPTPLTWQCMDAAAFRLLSRPPTATSIARPMDGLAIGPLSPQEDEFALLTMGVESAYRAFLMPHRLPELQHTLDPAFWLDHSAWLDRWEPLLKTIQVTASRPQLPMILKSPNHTFRLPSILRRFPAARVIWALRPANAVLNSNRKMWRTMFATHGIGKSPSSDQDSFLDAFLAVTLQRSAELLRWSLRELPPGQLTLCEQDALRVDPVATLTEIGTALGLEIDTGSAEFDAALASTGAGRVERYDQTGEGSAAVREALQDYDAAQSEALLRFKLRS